MIMLDQQSFKNSYYVLLLYMSIIDLIIKLHNLHGLTVLQNRAL